MQGYTDKEWAQFTKTERRIINMINVMKYEVPQICAALDIGNSTFRGHMSNIKRKVAAMKAQRYNDAAKVDVARQSAVHLPEFSPGEVAAQDPVLPLRPAQYNHGYPRLQPAGLKNQERMRDQLDPSITPPAPQGPENAPPIPVPLFTPPEEVTRGQNARSMVDLTQPYQSENAPAAQGDSARQTFGSFR